MKKILAFFRIATVSISSITLLFSSVNIENNINKKITEYEEKKILLKN